MNPYQTNNNPYDETNKNPYAQPYVQPQPYGTPYDQSQPPYAQTYQQTNVPPYGYTEPYQETHVPLEPTVEGKFVESTPWRDVPFAILFIIHLVGTGIILGFGLATPLDTNNYNGVLPYWMVENNQSLWRILGMCGIPIATAVIFSLLYLQLMKTFPTFLIYTGILVNVLTFVGAAIWLGMSGSIFGAIMLGMFALFVVFYFLSVRSRIPFAVEMIKAVVTIIQNYPATQVTAYVSVIVQVAYIVLWGSAMMFSQRLADPYNKVTLAYLIFSFYWTLEVIKNIVHVTVSGLVATVYFMGDMMPRNPTLGAFRRAITTSFGSVCFGSLIVALIKTLRTAVQMMRREDNGILLCIADCLLGCIDSIVQYFNHYAFVQVAIYGKSFCDAARSTWSLFQHSGLETIANDNLIDGVLWMGILFNAILSGGVGALIGYFLMADMGANTVYILFVAGFCIGFVLMILAMQVVDSSVACSFVCFAEDKQVLQRTNPELYQRLMETYHLAW